ncbi:MAG TPA: mandelate racemase/muconate lactonizing enzyme family protein [Xanthobacteraceae bacterium]
MKIVRLDDFHADGGWDTYSFLKITTDEGITGWSEFNESRRRGMTALIHGLGAALIGHDPRAVARIEAALYAQNRSTAGGLSSHAIAAIVNACLDIKGKALGVPVCELLGGALRERMPVYWSRCGVLRARCAELFDGKVIEAPAVRSVDDLKAAAREARERGFKAIKTNVLVFDGKGGRPFAPGMTGAGLGHPELNLTDDVLDALIVQLAALREGAGPGVRLLLDLNFNYKPEGLRRIAKAVEPFNLMWLEMDLHDPLALSLIRQSTATPIGSLETILGRRSLKPYLEHRSADIAIIDAQWNGLPEAVRMAAMADAYEVNVASHNFNGPLANIMSAHFCAAIPNFRIMEFDVDEVPWKPKLLTRPYVLENGELLLPTGAGWGTAVNEAVIRAHPAKM